MIIAPDGTIIKNYDFTGTSLEDEVAKLLEAPADE
jgi:hypothetical protein